MAPEVSNMSAALHPTFDPNDPAAVECYQTALRTLTGAGIEFLVGGAYAFARFAGIARHTKDLDLFLRRRDLDAALTALKAAGYRPEVTYSHWLAKAYKDGFFIDLIYGSGNGVCLVDDSWFAHALEGEVLGLPVRLCPPEETLWSKAFIMERDRYDGADVTHILRAGSERLDWNRVLHRFGPNWRVLYSHLLLFGFIYPAERDRIPEDVMRELGRRVTAELDARPPESKVCRGTLLAALQYSKDVEEWGYEDARLPPHGSMTSNQVETWVDGVRNGR
jgi:hypothetical protein